MDGSVSNPFGCPENVWRAMLGQIDEEQVVLRAVISIGPSRIQWMGSPKRGKGYVAFKEAETCWALDGERATVGELVEGARD